MRALTRRTGLFVTLLVILAVTFANQLTKQQDVLTEAAEVAVKALREALEDFSDVILERVQYSNIRAQQVTSEAIALEIGGMRFTLQSTLDEKKASSQEEADWRKLPLPTNPQAQARADRQALLEAWKPVMEGAELQAFSVQGPLELWLTEPRPVPLLAPGGAIDSSGPLRRIIVESGVELEVHGAKSLELATPLDLTPESDSAASDTDSDAESDTSGKSDKDHLVPVPGRGPIPRGPDLARLLAKLRRRAAAAAEADAEGRHGNLPAPGLLQIRADLTDNAFLRSDKPVKLRRLGGNTAIILAKQVRASAAGAAGSSLPKERVEGSNSSPVAAPMSLWPLGGSISEDVLGRYQIALSQIWAEYGARSAAGGGGGRSGAPTIKLLGMKVERVSLLKVVLQVARAPGGEKEGRQLVASPIPRGSEQAAVAEQLGLPALALAAEPLVWEALLRVETGPDGEPKFIPLGVNPATEIPTINFAPQADVSRFQGNETLRLMELMAAARQGNGEGMVL